MSIDSWIAFVVTLYAVSIIPGPSMVLALTHGLRFGAKATISTAVGSMCASAIQATISVAGLGVIIASSGSVFVIIKYIGALYLIYLGIMLWRSPAWDMSRIDNSQKQAASLTRMFNQGFMVSIGNPKAIVFFTALFPQFISTDANSIYQHLTLIALTCSSAFICAMVYAVGGNQLAKVFKRSNLSKMFNKLTGGFFISGGVSLLLANRG